MNFFCAPAGERKSRGPENESGWGGVRKMELLGTNRWDPLVNGGKCTMSELRVKLFNLFLFIYLAVSDGMGAL